MTAKRNFTDHSRVEWHKEKHPLDYPGDAEMVIGCLQRIATAMEAMAKNHIQLISEVEWRTRRMKELQADNKRMANRCAGYAGYVKKFKKKRRK